MGSYITIINDTDDTFSVKVGADKTALFAGTLIAGTIATIISCGAFAGVLTGTIVTIGAGISVGSAITSTSFGIHSALSKEGYVTLKPGERHQYGKMALSLWQQCHCIRTRSDGSNLLVEEIYMKPIFSGATDGSNNDHCIKWWVDKYGVSEVSRHAFVEKK